MDKLHPSCNAGSVVMTGFIILFFGVFIAFLFGFDRSGLWLIPLILSSFSSSYFVWSKYPWESSLAPYISFGGALLLACFLNRIFYLADFVVSGERFSEWPFYARNQEIAVLKAEVLTVLGIFITFVAWIYAGGLKVSRLVVLAPTPALGVHLLTTIYAISMVVLVGAGAFGQIAGLAQLMNAILGLGAACAFFLPAQAVEGRLLRLALSALMCAPFFYQALGSGMKENIILSILPLGYYFWIAVRSRFLRLISMLFVLVFLGLLTSYIGFFRAEVWQKDRALSQRDVVKGYSQLVARHGLESVLGNGIKQFFQRSNASSYRGWAISRADEYGYEPELVFAPMVYVFIPRMIWPDKPMIRQGWEYSGLVFGSRYTYWSSSSTAAGYYPALYLGGGWLAVLIGAVVVGLIIALFMRLAWRLGGLQLLYFYSFSIIPYALRLDETWTVGAISGPVIGFVYVWVIYFLLSLFYPKASLVRFTRSSSVRALDAQRKL